MITLYQFNQLIDNQKAEATWEGTYLGNRCEGDHIVQLYSLPDFYVEVYYQPESNTITRFRSFKTIKLLAPYIHLQLETTAAGTNRIRPNPRRRLGAVLSSRPDPSFPAR